MRRLVCACLVLLCLAVVERAVAAEPEQRWVAAAPDDMIELSLRAALADGPDAIARAVLIAAYEEQASAGVAYKALTKIGQSGAAIAGDARWLGAMLEPEKVAPWPGPTAVAHEDQPGAMVRSWAILGPFEDTGGGLERKEGPDLPDHSYRSSDYSWGVYAVRPQRSIVDTVNPRGLPLDLHVHPRSESCTYLGTSVLVPEPRPLTVRIASSGSLRAAWDGQRILSDAAVHRMALLDRAAIEIRVDAGMHLLTLKVCTGAQADTGRVRVRFTDDKGADLKLLTSSDPAKLDPLHERFVKDAPPKVEHHLRATSLQTATDLSQGAPTIDRALSAVVLLRLAGADDQRSLRAPGLLDALVGSQGLDTDRLSLAGDLAPFTSNSSGWLGQALDRARAEGDHESAGFAQRALVLLRLDDGADDLAQATAAEEPLASQTDPYVRWLRAKVLLGMGGSGLRYRARKELETIVQQSGADTPLGVWRTLAQTSGFTSQRLKALLELAGRTSGDRGPEMVSAHGFLGAVTLERTALSEVLHQSHASQVIRIGKMLHEAGRYAAAKDVLQLATAIAPNRAEGFVALARVLTTMAAGSADDATTLSVLQRAVELDPSTAALGAELRFRKGDTKLEADPGLDAQYIVDAKVFLARAADKPAPKEGLFSRSLHWRRVVRLHPDKRVSQMMHYAREIIVPPRTEGERYERMPGGRRSELLLARVHKKNGAVLPPEEQDASGPMVRWPPLERGDVVEISVRSWTPGPVGRRGDAPFYFVDYVGSVETRPILYNDVVIDAPVGSSLAFDVVGGKPDAQRVSEKGGRKVTHLIWTAPPVIADEPYAPSRSELLPVVVGSIYPTWEVFLGWYQGAIEGFTQPDEQIKRMAEEITAEAKAKTREEKVQALFEFVADDIRYVNYQSGEWWLPNRPQHLLARRQGDCDDKAMLLISMLKAVGIQASEVLVQTRHTAQRRLLQSAKVAIPMFDHGIVYLPDEDGEGGRFLDATSPQSRLGPLPGMDSGAVTILVEPGSAIHETSTADPADHGVSAEWTLKVASDGSGSIRAVERHFGDQAFRLRTHLQAEDTRAQWVEGNLIAGWFSALEMDPRVEFDGALGAGVSRVTYSARSKSLARREGQSLVFAVAPPRPITAALAPLVSRTLPVELPSSAAPQRRTLVITLEAPASHVFGPLPPDGVAEGGSFGKAALSFVLSKDKRAVTITRELTMAAWRIPVGEYPAWRAWLQQIDALWQRTVRLVPQGTSAASSRGN